MWIYLVIIVVPAIYPIRNTASLYPPPDFISCWDLSALCDLNKKFHKTSGFLFKSGC